MSEKERDPYLEERFPKLRNGQYTVTSPEGPRYNCVAYAAGDTKSWWEHIGPGLTRGSYFWPCATNTSDSLESWIEAFRLQNYQLTDNDTLEPGYEKVAIYVDSDGFPTHIAKQTPVGQWKSKLGKGKDIQHDTLELLAGNEADEYGTINTILKRRTYPTDS